MSATDPQASTSRSGPDARHEEATPAQGRKAETQARILAIAIERFATHGFDRTSVSAIAQGAGVSQSAVFWHFGDKEGLFREALRRLAEPFFQEIKATFAHMKPHEQVHTLVATYERVVGEHDSAIRSIIQWLLESERPRAIALELLFRLHDQFVRDVHDAFVELGANDREAGELAAAVVSLLDGNLLLSWVDTRPETLTVRRAGVRKVVEQLLSYHHGR